MNSVLPMISDLPKGMAYRFGKWEKVIVPASSIIKTPSMELRPNHPDQGS